MTVLLSGGTALWREVRLARDNPPLSFKVGSNELKVTRAKGKCLTTYHFNGDPKH